MIERTDDPQRLDRRTMLARAVAASAATWSAPILLSSPAEAANGICTAKCAGTPLVCFNFLQTSSPGPCTTFVMNSMTLLRTGNCPCSSGPPLAGCLTWPSTMTFTGTGGPYTVSVSSVGAFTISGLPTGDVTVTASSTSLLTARMYCLDKNGDQVWTTCTYRLSLRKNSCSRSITGFGKVCTYPSSNTCGPSGGGCTSTSPTVSICSNNNRNAGGDVPGTQTG